LSTHIEAIGIPVAEARTLRHEIGTRQLSMIAVGGAIGTGLFFASGGAIAQAGPGGAMLAYAIMGLAVYCMMQSLGEMATQLPIPGSFEAYAERFVDPSLGFAAGLELLVQLGDHTGGRTGRWRTHRAVLVSAFQFRRSGRQVFSCCC
jgi:amino acid permease